MPQPLLKVAGAYSLLIYVLITAALVSAALQVVVFNAALGAFDVFGKLAKLIVKPDAEPSALVLVFVTLGKVQAFHIVVRFKILFKRI